MNDQPRCGNCRHLGALMGDRALIEAPPNAHHCLRYHHRWGVTEDDLQCSSGWAPIDTQSIGITATCTFLIGSAVTNELRIWDAEPESAMRLIEQEAARLLDCPVGRYYQRYRVTPFRWRITVGEWSWGDLYA